MKNYFYAHLVDMSDISRELDILEIYDAEKNELILMIESTIHHKVVDVILTELSEDHKIIFLQHIKHDDHKKVWALLKDLIKNPEKKILKEIKTLKKEFIRDIMSLVAEIQK